MMQGARTFFTSESSESTLATITLANEVSSYNRAVEVKVKNTNPADDAFTGDNEDINDLTISFQYTGDGGSSWTDISGDLTDDVVDAGASKVYNIYLPKGNQLRVRGSGATRGFIELGLEGNVYYRPDSPLSDQTGVL